MLRYALIGCGVVAAKHLKAALYHKKDLEICALVDSSQDAMTNLLLRSNLRTKPGAIIKQYENAAEMLKQERPELTAITTPSGSHFNLAKAALLADSHVIVEKPLTLSLQEADELLELAKRKNLKIAVGHIYRFFPLVQLIQKQLREERWGRILYGDVKVRWGHDQAYYDQAGWRGTWQADGGALMNQSIHALDLMLWLLGGNITAACGWIDQLSHQMEAEDFGLGMFRLDNGVYCSLEGTTSTDPGRQEASFYICCEQGEIRAGIMSGKPKIEIFNRQGKKQTTEIAARYLAGLVRAQGLSSILQMKNPHSFLYKDMIEAIKQNRTPLASGECGRQALEAVLAVYKAALQKKKVDLPLNGFALTDMENYF